jgi:hypothetical protein
LISEKTGLQYKKIQLVIGKEVEDISKSTTKLFAICKKKSGWPLRVTMFSEMAEMWKDNSVIVKECNIII